MFFSIFRNAVLTLKWLYHRFNYFKDHFKEVKANEKSMESNKLLEQWSITANNAENII